jgi:hypothetical protein
VPEQLPKSIDVGLFRSDFSNEKKWRNIDTTIYRWFANRAINAEKYLIIEYDCLCKVDLRDYYFDVWDADVAGIDLFTKRENPRWRWFAESELAYLPPADHKHAAGIVPLTCTMFSHAALEQIVATTYRNDVFCELRLGTTIKKLGLRFSRLPLLKRSTICYHGYSWQTNRPGLFHSVKSLAHNNDKRDQPGIVGSCFHDLMRSFTRDRSFMPFHLDGRLKALRNRFSTTRI